MNEQMNPQTSIIRDPLSPLPTTVNTEIDLPNVGVLTPDQKRNLLFNVNRPLELSMQVFDDEWWPLVSNVWTGFNLKKQVNGDSSQTYMYRFTKHNKSST